jgi:hypothetical protein
MKPKKHKRYVNVYALKLMIMKSVSKYGEIPCYCKDM